MIGSHDFSAECLAIPPTDIDKKLSCNFCGKFEHEVLLLIAGPRGEFVCNECIELMVDIIRGTVPDFCLGEKP